MPHKKDKDIYENTNPTVVKQGGSAGVWLIRFIRFLMPIAVLAAGGLVTYWMLETTPQARPRPKHRSAALVEVKKVKFEDRKTVITAMGTVIPAKQIDLNSQVSGEVVHTAKDFIPGGLVRKGEPLLKIDPSEYELAVRQTAGEVADVQTRLKLEKGRQLVARQEFAFLKQHVSDEEKDLILRKPQLESLQALLESAQAKHERAKLDLARTRINIPFNAVIRSTHVNIGARVTPATSLAAIAGTDTFWIEVLVPVNRLQWIRIPSNNGETGSVVKIFDPAAWGPDGYRIGRVIRLSPGLEEQGRMAKLLVSVQDPLVLLSENKENHRVLINAYVRVEIEGIGLSRAAVIDRGHIRDGEYAWIMDENDRLEIRKVTISFKDRTHVYVTGGIREGERLLTTDLSTPVSGMMLRTKDSIKKQSPDTHGPVKKQEGKKDKAR